MKKILVLIVIIALSISFLAGCGQVQTNNLPQTFNYPPKIAYNKVETSGTPLFVDEGKKIFIVKEGIGAFAKIKFGRSLDSLKTALQGGGKLFVNLFDERIMYVTNDDGTYLSENYGRSFRKITDSSKKIVSMGFSYNGDVFAIVNCSSQGLEEPFLYRFINKEKLEKINTNGRDPIWDSGEFIFNTSIPNQFITGRFITNDGGKTLAPSDKLSRSPCAFNPYNCNEIYEYLDRYAPILLVNLNSKDFKWQKIYPVNPVITHENFEQFYTDFKHKITYAIDNYNTLFALIDRRVFKIARLESPAQLKIEFIEGSGIFYLLPSEGNFYYKVKISGEDNENKNIGVVEAEVEIPEVTYEVPFAKLKSKYVDIGQELNHSINTVAMSGDAFVYLDVKSKPDIIFGETLKLYDISTGDTEVVSTSNSSELLFDVNGQVNENYLLYSMFVIKEREIDSNSLKIYAYNRKLHSSKLILQSSDIIKIFSGTLKENYKFDVVNTYITLSGNAVLVGINAEISTIIKLPDRERIEFISGCISIFKVDLLTDENSVIFKETVPQSDTRIITKISASNEYIAVSYTEQDDAIVYLYSLKDGSLNKILEIRGYDAKIIEDNNLIFEDDGVAYIAPVKNPGERTPITFLTGALFNCAASSNYIVYSHYYEETNLVNNTKTYSSHFGTEIYNRVTHKKSLIKDCFFYNAFIDKDTLVIFGCGSKYPNRLYFINLKENEF
jgi:hypothetical protein